MRADHVDLGVANSLPAVVIQVPSSSVTASRSAHFHRAPAASRAPALTATQPGRTGQQAGLDAGSAARRMVVARTGTSSTLFTTLTFGCGITVVAMGARTAADASSQSNLRVFIAPRFPSFDAFASVTLGRLYDTSAIILDSLQRFYVAKTCSKTRLRT